MVGRRAALDIAVAYRFNHNLNFTPYILAVALKTDAILPALKGGKAHAFHLIRYFVSKGEGTGMGPIRILKGKRTMEPHTIKQIHSGLKVGICLARKPDDDVGG
jgi:hypothetical protein